MSKSDDRAKLAAARLRGFFGDGPPAPWPEMEKAVKELGQLARPAMREPCALTAKLAFNEYLKRNDAGRQRKGDAIGYSEEEWLAFEAAWNARGAGG